MTGASRPATWREHLHEVIFEADTRAGKAFDVALLVAIGISATVVILESAALAMVLGYSLIIIPTGIFSMELVRAGSRPMTTQSCPQCAKEGYDRDAAFCKHCGGAL